MVKKIIRVYLKGGGMRSYSDKAFFWSGDLDSREVEAYSDSGSINIMTKKSELTHQSKTIDNIPLSDIDRIEVTHAHSSFWEAIQVNSFDCLALEIFKPTENGLARVEAKYGASAQNDPRWRPR